MKLLSDVNLNAVAFSPDGKTVTLSFIDMYGGEPAGVIRCSSVLSLCYQNIFDEEEGFAAYVGEVTYLRVEPENISSFLASVNFPFSGVDGNVYSPNAKGLRVLHIEGGEVILDVVCKALEKDGVAII